MATRQYQIISDFPGYRRREEETKLPAGTLVFPSKNVVVNTAGRVAQVQGYATDGDESQTSDNGIQGWYDFDTKNDTRRNMRSGFLTSGDGKVQFRYKDANDVVTWKTILSSLASASFSFTPFWDTTDLIKLCLFVNGDGNVYEWNGFVGAIASTTVNSIILTGTLTAAQQGVYTTRNMTVVINGTEYTYTGVSGNTLTGVTTDPRGEANGSIVFQKVVTNAVSGMSPAAFQAFKPDVIQKSVQNVIYYGSSISNQVWVSKVDNFKDCTVTSPTRIVGEGFVYILDAPARGFVPQETGGNLSSEMIISAGRDWLYREVRTLSSDLTKETLSLKPLRTGRLQAALDAHSITRTKNGFVYLGNDKVLNLLGQISTQFVPELTDLSMSIVDDMNGYDHTGGATYYHKNFIYRSVPLSGIIRAYNMTDPQKPYWEAPITYPIAGFYVTEDGELGGHGYASSESYLLFTGHRFRANVVDEGFPIEAFAYFAPYAHTKSFQGGRSSVLNRSATKKMEELFIDGYISSNTELYVGTNSDLDGCQLSRSKLIVGSNTDITCPLGEGGSLGTTPFGTTILGDGLVAPTRPPYFNTIKTFPPYAATFEQVFFVSYGIDFDWEIISFGSDAIPTDEDDASIKD